jgi:hypothetical protein
LEKFKKEIYLLFAAKKRKKQKNGEKMGAKPPSPPFLYILPSY